MLLLKMKNSIGKNEKPSPEYLIIHCRGINIIINWFIPMKEYVANLCVKRENLLYTLNG